jgi:hypothetical protein
MMQGHCIMHMGMFFASLFIDTNFMSEKDVEIFIATRTVQAGEDLMLTINVFDKLRYIHLVVGIFQFASIILKFMQKHPVAGFM